MAFCSRGKQMLQKCLVSQKSVMNPIDSAEWWIKCGLDRDGFAVKYIPNTRGSGVFATQVFQAGDFLLEYSGELYPSDAISENKRKSPNVCFFTHDGKHMCVDATHVFGRLGRIVRDGVDDANAKMKVITLKSSAVPHLALFATKDIDFGEEIKYDYEEYFHHNLHWRLKDLVADDNNSDTDSDPFDLDDRKDLDYVPNNTDSDSFDLDDKKDLDYVPNNTDSDSFDLDDKKDLDYVPNSVLSVDTDPNSDIIDVLPTTLPIKVPDLSRFLNGSSDAYPHSPTKLTNINRPQCIETSTKEHQSNHCDEGFTLHNDTQDMEFKSDKKKKPSRPCLFCGQFFCDLTRHIKLVHKDEYRVKEIMSNERSGKISRKERIQEFDKIRKEGILKKNKESIITKGHVTDAHLICERQSSGEKVMCTSCHGFFSKKHFYKHKVKCRKVAKTGDDEPYVTALSANKACSSTALDPEVNSAWEKLYASMKRDDCFDIIDKDDIIKVIGKHIFESRRPNKQREAKFKARSAMRRLARLVILTENVENASDLFTTQNCYHLESAIKKMCEDAISPLTSMKAGLNIALGTLIKLSCRILIPHFLIAQLRDKADAVKDFQYIFTTPTYYAKLFSSAEYQLKEKRQRQNRKPNALPAEDDVSSLIKFLEQEINSISSSGIQSKSDFVRLRRAVVAHVTLFNAKRGSEVSRLKIADWEERSSWITPDKVHGSTADLVKRYSITYIMGKGDSLVPVIFPNKSTKAIDMLADKSIRNMVGVSNTNQFLFPYTESSDDGSVGYNEIMSICRRINIPIITATAIRHRASTKLWEMEDIDEAAINSFMDHMGHQKDIDRNVYACPPALKALKHVTPILESINQDCVISRAEDSTEETFTSNGNHPPKAKKLRTYTRWSEESTSSLVKTFGKYISGERGNLYPGRNEIEVFQSSCGVAEVKEMHWAKIKTKIFNEKIKLEGSLKRLESI